MADEKNPIDDQYDIHDDVMELDDAVMSDAPPPAEPLETNPDPDASNWQTELVSKATAAKLPSEVIERLKSADAVDVLLAAISGAVQKQVPEAREEPVRTESEPNQFGLDIDEATAFDPDMAKALKAMNAFYAERIRSLEAKIADRSDADSRVETGSFVKELGSDWKSVFGSDDKPNAQNMKRLEEAASTIRAGFAARHKRVPPQRELLRMALNAEFGDRQGEIARNSFNDKVAKRASQIVSRPGTRTTPPANPRVRAAQGVADWFKSKGIDPYGASEDAFS